MPNDPFASLQPLADQEFAAFGSALQSAGVEAKGAWNAVEYAKAELANAASICEDAINAALDDPYLPEEAKQLRVRQARDIFDAAQKEAANKMSAGIDVLNSALELAARSDFTVSDPATRSLLRDDIKMAVSGIKGSLLPALFDLARNNPAYAAELENGFADSLLRQHGEDSTTIRAFHSGITTVTAPRTPKATAARKAIASLARVQAHATTSLPNIARVRVETAAAPRQTAGFRPDTIIPRR